MQLAKRQLDGRVDGLLLDLGVSSMQLDQADRGFSFSQDGPLDMRMDCAAPQSARDVVNGWSEQELGRVLREFGEEKAWRTVARRIVDARCVRRPCLRGPRQCVCGTHHANSRKCTHGRCVRQCVPLVCCATRHGGAEARDAGRPVREATRPYSL